MTSCDIEIKLEFSMWFTGLSLVTVEWFWRDFQNFVSNIVFLYFFPHYVLTYGYGWIILIVTKIVIERLQFFVFWTFFTILWFFCMSFSLLHVYGSSLNVTFQWFFFSVKFLGKFFDLFLGIFFETFLCNVYTCI